MTPVNNEGATAPLGATAEALHYRRRLSDKILVAFHHACDESDAEIGGQLLMTLETLLARRFADPKYDRRKSVESLVGAHNRLWHLKQQRRMPAAFPAGLEGPITDQA